MTPRFLASLWDPDGPRGARARLLAGALAVPELLFRAGVAVREGLLRVGLLRVERAPVAVISVTMGSVSAPRTHPAPSVSAPW